MPLRHLFASLAAIIALILSGCTSVQPSPAQMLAESASFQLPHTPGAGKAVVYVVFDEAYVKQQLGFDVYLDGQQPAAAVGRNRGGEYFYFEVTPGDHVLYSKGEKWAELPLSVKAGDIVYVRQEWKMGMMEARVSLQRLDEVAGKYYVSKLTPGLAVTPMVPAAPATTSQPGTAAAAAPDTFIGTITGGNMAKGVGFSNPNVRLIVTPDTGVAVIFFVRSDSKVFDVSGKQVDYLEAIRMFKKRVSIEHFVIRDGTGGQPGRSDFAYEIGEKGVRSLRVLEK
ncbi:MAG TPA: DUF2846 domain-containing protein [Gallionellaceae bacterium]